MDQVIIFAHQNYSALDSFFISNKIQKVFLVHTKSFLNFKISKYFASLKEKLGIDIVSFTNFHPNPDYDSVVEGEKLFRETNCDCIIAVGGGSSIDVAKCIKLYMGLDNNKLFFEQVPIPNDIKLIVAPTTAGTGSEATRYAVIYYKGEKQSITHDTCIPSEVIFDSAFLHTLPDYQRKSTMLDALCHSLEAYWSVNSTAESKTFSEKAINIILENLDSYLRNEEKGNYNMLMAANLAGKAINITQTTAGHAMCYKLTSMYGIAHGHAAALCVNKLWPFMVNNTQKSNDARGKEYLDNMFSQLAQIMGCKSVKEATVKFSSILQKLNIEIPNVKNVDDFDMLKISVNPVRIKNNPIKLTEEDINILYHQILRNKN
ncbi:phosphonoacetaldehyde reductase [Treponema sp. C6A8]|uniref:phosphonoacetaldehyde reductase n=1 Tax=Treponema sp. C6A8 TaxID=1410609 RepID=UPI000487E7B9|nr:phosphonoacetaldehyde reductase [Treponema sp. C6A8]